MRQRLHIKLIWVFFFLFFKFVFLFVRKIKMVCFSFCAVTATEAIFYTQQRPSNYTIPLKAVLEHKLCE